MNKSKLFLAILLISFSPNYTNAQTKGQRIAKPLKGSDIFKTDTSRKNENFDKVLNESSNNYVDTQNSDFGSSKYDSKINWDADINKKDVQGSLNRFRDEQWEKEYGLYRNIGITILLLGILFVIFRRRKTNAD